MRLMGVRRGPNAGPGPLPAGPTRVCKSRHFVSETRREALKSTSAGRFGRVRPAKPPCRGRVRHDEALRAGHPAPGPNPTRSAQPPSPACSPWVCKSRHFVSETRRDALKRTSAGRLSRVRPAERPCRSRVRHAHPAPQSRFARTCPRAPVAICTHEHAPADPRLPRGLSCRRAARARRRRAGCGTARRSRGRSRPRSRWESRTRRT